MVMPGRYTQSTDYRYAYNGMEQDNEVKGNGNSYTTEFRQYDPRLGRWLSLDPLMHIFPHMSPYVAFDNNPVYYIDPYGLEGTTPEGLPDNPCDGDVRTADNGKEYEYMINDQGEGAWARKFEAIEVVADRCLYLFVNNTVSILEQGHESGSLYSMDITVMMTGAYNPGVFEKIVDEFRSYLDCRQYYPPITSLNKPSQYEELHNALDWLGMIPVFGEVFDAFNALIYAAEGDFINAGISTSAIFPIFGSLGTGARQMKKVASELIQEAEERVVRDVGQEMVDDISPHVIEKIDRNLLDPPAKHGNAPTFKSDGTPVEIHHVNQNPKGPFKEMHWEDHRGGGNYKKNHPGGGLTKKERIAFDKQRKAYWKKEYPQKK